jgi:hypothetical protein
MDPRLFPEEGVEVRWVGRLQYACLVKNWLYLASAISSREGQIDCLTAILQSCSSLIFNGASSYYDPCILQVCVLQ